MIPNPIHKVLSTLSCHGVRHLLMGGQACVFYGAAEFSRDCDVVLDEDETNLARLKAALADLEAKCIAVPPFDVAFLNKGHAIHFRCERAEAKNIRLDVMSRMRGCEDFPALWERRTSLEVDQGVCYEILGIEDLVRAKKTQRDKDWPMIARLVDAHYEQFRDDANDERVRFWLREARTPETLIAVVAEYPSIAAELGKKRPAIGEAMSANHRAIRHEFDREREEQRVEDENYWGPLKRELELLRRQRKK